MSFLTRIQDPKSKIIIETDLISTLKSQNLSFQQNGSLISFEISGFITLVENNETDCNKDKIWSSFPIILELNKKEISFSFDPEVYALCGELENEIDCSLYPMFCPIVHKQEIEQHLSTELKKFEWYIQKKLRHLYHLFPNEKDHFVLEIHYFDNGDVSCSSKQLTTKVTEVGLTPSEMANIAIVRWLNLNFINNKTAQMKMREFKKQKPYSSLLRDHDRNNLEIGCISLDHTLELLHFLCNSLIPIFQERIRALSFYSDISVK